MKLIVLHGNGLVGSLDRITQIKKDFDPLSITELGYKGTNAQLLSLGLSTSGLFSEKRLVIIDNIDSDFDLSILPDTTEDLTVVLKFSKALASNSKLLKEAINKKAQVIQITEAEDASIFPFLDKLAEQNRQVFLELDRLYKSYGSQYLLTMIFYMLRRLVLTPKTLPAFVLKKIENQKKHFPSSKMAEVYRLCLETDYKIKNGLTEERLGLTLLIQKIITH